MMVQIEERLEVIEVSLTFYLLLFLLVHLLVPRKRQRSQDSFGQYHRIGGQILDFWYFKESQHERLRYQRGRRHKYMG